MVLNGKKEMINENNYIIHTAHMIAFISLSSIISGIIFIKKTTYIGLGIGLIVGNIMPFLISLEVIIKEINK